MNGKTLPRVFIVGGGFAGIAAAIESGQDDMHDQAGLSQLAEVLRSEVSRFVAVVRDS